MKAVLTIKNGNKADESFCRDLEVSQQEYELLKETFSHINSETGQQYASILVYQI